jgi:SAM-dependent methyltransferase
MLKAPGSTVLRSWIFYAGLAAWVPAVVLLVAGRVAWAAACAALALSLDLVGRVWSRKSPVPMPHSMRWILSMPRGTHSPRRLLGVLRPQPGEQILEIGPGVGIHALPVASALLPHGVLHVLDVQAAMLEELVRRAGSRGLTNIVPALGDAQALPYPDATFDAAYLVTVLGEIPDPHAALAALRRVLKPGGRLLVCEFFVDPDFLALAGLRQKAAGAGFAFAGSFGPPFAYTAMFRPASV